MSSSTTGGAGTIYLNNSSGLIDELIIDNNNISNEAAKTLISGVDIWTKLSVYKAIAIIEGDEVIVSLLNVDNATALNTL